MEIQYLDNIKTISMFGRVSKYHIVFNSSAEVPSKLRKVFLFGRE